jgi:hypothetical protein
MLRIYRVATQLEGSRVVLSSIEWVSKLVIFYLSLLVLFLARFRAKCVWSFKGENQNYFIFSSSLPETCTKPDHGHIYSCSKTFAIFGKFSLFWKSKTGFGDHISVCMSAPLCTTIFFILYAVRYQIKRKYVVTSSQNFVLYSQPTSRREITKFGNYKSE